MKWLVFAITTAMKGTTDDFSLWNKETSVPDNNRKKKCNAVSSIVYRQVQLMLYPFQKTEDVLSLINGKNKWSSKKDDSFKIGF